jgi:hypothetical protein
MPRRSTRRTSSRETSPDADEQRRNEVDEDEGNENLDELTRVEPVAAAVTQTARSDDDLSHSSEIDENVRGAAALPWSNYRDERKLFVAQMVNYFLSRISAIDDLANAKFESEDAKILAILGPEFEDLQRSMINAHTQFFDLLEPERSNDNTIPVVVEGESSDYDESANCATQGMIYRYTELALTNFPYLSVFLCNIPGLNINFAPEVNHRKVDPSQYSQAREAGFSTDKAATTMFDVLDEKRDSLGLGSKQLLIFPFALHAHALNRQREPIIDESSPKTQLRSVMQVPFKTDEIKANSATIEITSHVCRRSTMNDFVRLQFLLNTNKFGEPNCVRSWHDVLNNDFKLSTENGIKDFIRKTDFPESIIQRTNRNGTYGITNIVHRCPNTI